MIRFPKICTRCGMTGHLAKDCDQQEFGISQCEREFRAEARADRNSLLLLLVVFVVAHIIFSILGDTPL